MKKLVVSLAVVFSLGLVVSCNSSNSNSSAESEVVEMEKKELLAENKEAVDMKVEGMVCAMGCAKYIEDKVAALDGVVLSEVNFEEGLAHFEYDKTVTSPEDLEKFIADIHDGQYKAEVVTAEELEEAEQELEELEEEELGSEDSEEEVAAVYQRFQFSIPDLLGYFLQGLR